MIMKSFSCSIPRLVSMFLALSLHLSNSGANETFVVQAKQAKLESLLPTTPEEEVKSTILNAINTHEDVIGFIVFDILVDDVKISSDGRWATARLYFLDKTNLEKIPGEPSLALGEKS